MDISKARAVYDSLDEQGKADWGSRVSRISASDEVKQELMSFKKQEPASSIPEENNESEDSYTKTFVTEHLENKWNYLSPAIGGALVAGGVLFRSPGMVRAGINTIKGGMVADVVAHATLDGVREMTEGEFKEKNPGLTKLLEIGVPLAAGVTAGWKAEGVHLLSRVQNGEITLDVAEKMAKARILEGATKPIAAKGAKASKAIKTFFDPFYSLPQSAQYEKARNIYQGSLHRSEDLFSELSKKGKHLTEEQGALVQSWLGAKNVDKAKFFNQMDDTTKEVANSFKSSIDDLQDELLEAGLISTKKEDYTRRFFGEHIFSKSPFRYGSIEMGAYKARKENITEVAEALKGLYKNAGKTVPMANYIQSSNLKRMKFFDDVASDSRWVFNGKLKGVINPTTGREYGYKDAMNRLDFLQSQKLSSLNKVQLDELANLKKGLSSFDGASLLDQGFRKIPRGETVTVNGKTISEYGALGGKYVRKEIYDDVYGNPRLLSGTAFNFMKSVTQVSKQMLVPLNPAAYVRNTMGAITQSSLSDMGILGSVKGYSKAIHSFINIGKGSADKNTIRLFSELKDRGGFRSGFSHTELHKVAAEINPSMVGKAKEQLAYGMQVIGNKYGLIDEVNKFSLFRHARETMGMSADDAAIYAKKWGMDYTKVDKTIEFGRNTVAPFATWMYKITPLLAEAIIKRPMAIKGLLMAPQLHTEAFKSEHGVTDGDIERNKPSWMNKNGWWVPMSMDKDGNMEFFNLEAYLPVGYIASSFKALTEGDVLSASSKLVSSYGVSGNPVANAFYESITGIDMFTGNDWLKESDKLKTEDEMLAKLGHFGKKVAPPFVNQFIKATKEQKKNYFLEETYDHKDFLGYLVAYAPHLTAKDQRVKEYSFRLYKLQKEAKSKLRKEPNNKEEIMSQLKDDIELIKIKVKKLKALK